MGGFKWTQMQLDFQPNLCLHRTNLFLL